ncbi:MAG: hypothetical protein NTW25_06715, partial [Candidatus Kapabacteria bacterium]|nr:hypothetical protein [Candidatus Kapabacteria bacterium]
MNNLNSAFENELYFEFLKDPESVSIEWRNYFERNFSGVIDTLQKVENAVLNDNGIHNNSNSLQLTESKINTQPTTNSSISISSSEVKLASY